MSQQVFVNDHVIYSTIFGIAGIIMQFVGNDLLGCQLEMLFGADR